MTTCNIDNCELDAYQDGSKCILHCEKGDYSADFNKIGFLRLFNEELINYILESAFLHEHESGEINKATLKDHLEHNGHSGNGDVVEFVKRLTIVLTRIVFPSSDSRDSFDYLRVLNKLKAIHFDYCEFMSYGLKLSGVKCFFQDCYFHESWYIYNSPTLDDVIDNVLYQQCTFNKDVSSSSGERHEINYSLFSNCNFLGKINFYFVDFNAPIFHNTDDMHTEINELRFTDCNFNEKFVLNHCKIGKYFSENTVFHSKFEFKCNIVQDFDVNNTNHFKLVDYYKTTFKSFHIQKSIYEDFVGLEHCEFGVLGDQAEKYIATFMYATFLSFVNFRNTTFHSGLDIEHINLKESPNFLNTKINPKNSNRETFRTIKNSFDKIGNHIEANKFFVFEMKKYKEELANSNNYQERIIFSLNEKISNFGQSYIKSGLWIAATSVAYSLIVLGYEHDILYRLFPPANDVISTISKNLNKFAGNILPFSKLLKDGMEFVSLFFYIIFASLIWQTMVAVKRHTKR